MRFNAERGRDFGKAQLSVFFHNGGVSLIV